MVINKYHKYFYLICIKINFQNMEMKKIIIKQFKNSTGKQVGKGKKTPNRSSEATVIYDRDSTVESHDGVHCIFSAEFSNGRLGFRSRISPTYIVNIVLLYLSINWICRLPFQISSVSSKFVDLGLLFWKFFPQCS